MKRTRESLAYLTFLPEESFHCGTMPPVMKLKRGRIVIGRGSPTVPVDIVLSIKVDDKEIISRAHAEVVGDQEGKYYIRDLGSINGVFVNGCKADKYQLKEGDVVQFGGVAKMPVGKKIKNSAEHARYVFGFLGSSPSNTDRIDAAFNLRDYTTCRSFSSDKNLKTTSSDCARAGEIPVGPDRSVDQLTQQLALAQEEIEKLRANLLSTKPPPEPNNLLLNQQKRAGYISEMSSSIAQPAACMIDYSALQDMVKCSICQLTLLDAVVCRCSHGFCRACIETHARSKGRSCPVCSDGKRLSSSSTGRFYFRSENLDNIVYLLHQASSADDSKSFNMREKEHFNTLKKYGIDPMASPVSDSEELYDQTESRQPASLLHKQSKSSGRLHQGGVTCDYCGDEGHRHNRCPHDDSKGGKSFSNGKSRFGNYRHDDEDDAVSSDNSEDI